LNDVECYQQTIPTIVEIHREIVNRRLSPEFLILMISLLQYPIQDMLTTALCSA